MLGNKLEFEGLTGVGKVYLDLEPEQSVYTFIGANGVGKTKTLEALFQVLFFSNDFVRSSLDIFDRVFFKCYRLKDKVSGDIIFDRGDEAVLSWVKAKDSFISLSHELPVVYLGAQSRGIIESEIVLSDPIGTTVDRRKKYIKNLTSQMESK
ncbi:hypothetical protein, partial [Enterobacter cloacae]